MRTTTPKHGDMDASTMTMWDEDGKESSGMVVLTWLLFGLCRYPLEAVTITPPVIPRDDDGHGAYPQGGYVDIRLG